jgi:hypothetical protein
MQHAGIKIRQLHDGSISITNPKATHNMFHAQGLQYCNPALTPHIDGHDRSDMKTDEDMINLKTYQSIFGSCRFVADTIHPVIAYITGISGQHAHRPTARHMQAIMRIIRCVAGAINNGLYYLSRRTPTFAAFYDSDWASCSQTRNPKLASFLPSISSSALDFDQTTHDFIFQQGVHSLSPISLRIHDKPARDVTGIIMPHTIALGILLLWRALLVHSADLYVVLSMSFLSLD